MKTLQIVQFNVAGAFLEGYLDLPPSAIGLVIFAHGSGSSRNSIRNRKVATYLNDLGIGTLLTDLLTPEEDAHYENRFDIQLLSHRLTAVTTMICQRNDCKDLPVGYFGASTGSASALLASTEADIKAIVSRGGRPDLAGEGLKQIKSPTLLIVGGNDTKVISLNESAFSKLSCIKKLEVIPGATHLFEEPGTLEVVARLAGDWFVHFFKKIKT